ncbi:MAG: GcrA family cell cycle regulator [Xanthobacteraceae bacterium]|jgi:GcrA cell cycle regulator
MLDTTTTTPPDSTPVPARSPAPSPAHSPWTAERIEQLRNGVTSGLSCSQIAAEIGVTRNAVIGKIHRLGLSPGRPAAPARSCPPRARQPRSSPQRQFLRLMFTQAPGVAGAEAEATPVETMQRCSLLDLAPGECRWPVGDPCKADFAYCGNQAVAGFSYCAGHARMAYRAPARRRA